MYVTKTRIMMIYDISHSQYLGTVILTLTQEVQRL